MTDTPAVQSQSGFGAYTPHASGSSRISSLDLVRGLVMVLMAIDHVRVYAGVPAGGPTPGVFFTRWITHFVAPAFVFFAGTSAFLHGRKLGDLKALSRFLLLRGAWLVLLELTVLRVAWTFNLDFAHYMLAGVIWMIGWCMILLAVFVHVPMRVNAIAGCAIIALHPVLGMLGGFEGGVAGGLFTILYGGWIVKLGANGPPLYVLFVIVPWIGVMMAGYAFGHVMLLPPEARKRITLRIGIGATVAFLVLRGFDVGDPRHWQQTANAGNDGGSQAPALLRFLGTSKYPASLDFLLMTLGPTLILLAYADRIRGRAAEILTTFGRVPFFYYLLHIPVIHAAACVVSLIRTGRVDPWLFTNHPVAPADVPEGYRWSLGLLYLVFVLCVTALYFPCRWFARVRATRSSALLSYL